MKSKAKPVIIMRQTNGNSVWKEMQAFDWGPSPLAPQAACMALNMSLKLRRRSVSPALASTLLQPARPFACFPLHFPTPPCWYMGCPEGHSGKYHGSSSEQTSKSPHKPDPKHWLTSRLPLGGALQRRAWRSTAGLSGLAASAAFCSPWAMKAVSEATPSLLSARIRRGVSEELTLAHIYTCAIETHHRDSESPCSFKVNIHTSTLWGRGLNSPTNWLYLWWDMTQ